jgi:carbamoyltransferase
MLTIAFYGLADVGDRKANPMQFHFTHDHNMTILRNEKLLYHIQLERYTGIKHDNRLDEFIEEILYKIPKNYFNDNIQFISVNSFVGNSFISKGGKLRIEPKSEIRVEDKYCEAGCKFYFEGSRQHKKSRAFIMTHEFAHVATNIPFYGMIKPDSLLVHIDGGAFDSSSSVWYYNGEEFLHVHHSWDDVKDVVNYFNDNPLSFLILGEQKTSHLSLPGKLMGYSSFGTPREDVLNWLKENDWFQDHQGTEEEILDCINKEFGLNISSFDLHEKLLMDIAACFQKSFEDRVLDYLKDFIERSGAKNLYYSGGAALNIKTNAQIRNEINIDNVYIPPCCNDTGLSLGAAYFINYKSENSCERITPFIDGIDKIENIKKWTSEQISIIADYLAQDKVFGICTGYGESGPRALGHRSIIARADKINIRKLVSEVIKKREWYRPLAPVMSIKSAREVLEEEIVDELSRLMLTEFHVKEKYREKVAGVIHVDGTVRAQVIWENDIQNTLLFAILLEVERKYGMKALINTSFNSKGKPIVSNRTYALKTAREMQLDGVIFNDGLYLL